MDPYRFDEWTKTLVTSGVGRSRRAFLAGILRAGAAALGLAAASAGAARADDDDDDDNDQPRDAATRCQRKLDRCLQRSSFQKCSRCLTDLVGEGCPVPAPKFACVCTSDSYCADGNACTLDICSSNVCYNEPIGNQLSDCTQCRRDRQCPGGGKCCQGRCCPPGTTCSTNAAGFGICCATCGNGQTCCQEIRIDGEPNSSRDYYLGLATCVGQEGADFVPPLPTFCCGGYPGGYDIDENGQIGIGCFAPGRTLP